MKTAVFVMIVMAVAATSSWAQEITPIAWPNSEDASVAAPQSHEVLYEDENIRLLSVTIPPGESAPMHRHAMPSVLIIDSYAAITEHFTDGIKIMGEQIPIGAQVPFLMVRGPEAAHAVENTDTRPLHLYRLEFKDLEFQNVRRALEQVKDQIE